MLNVAVKKRRALLWPCHATSAQAPALGAGDRFPSSGSRFHRLGCECMLCLCCRRGWEKLSGVYAREVIGALLTGALKCVCVWEREDWLTFVQCFMAELQLKAEARGKACLDKIQYINTLSYCTVGWQIQLVFYLQDKFKTNIKFAVNKLSLYAVTVQCHRLAGYLQKLTRGERVTQNQGLQKTLVNPTLWFDWVWIWKFQSCVERYNCSWPLW